MINNYIIIVLGYPYGLEVTEVGAESVILKWHSTEKNVEEFKVRSQYIDSQAITVNCCRRTVDWSNSV